jgi:hypothetical protein
MVTEVYEYIILSKNKILMLHKQVSDHNYVCKFWKKISILSAFTLGRHSHGVQRKFRTPSTVTLQVPPQHSSGIAIECQLTAHILIRVHRDRSKDAVAA